MIITIIISIISEVSIYNLFILSAVAPLLDYLRLSGGGGGGGGAGAGGRGRREVQPEQGFNFNFRTQGKLKSKIAMSKLGTFHNLGLLIC